MCSPVTNEIPPASFTYKRGPLKASSHHSERKRGGEKRGFLSMTLECIFYRLQIRVKVNHYQLTLPAL